jgi:Cu(I)/Ag(I) efflux system membrane fusion protein
MPASSLAVGGSAKVVTVPVSAVIDSGTRQVVLLQKAAGRFEPREVKLGARSDDHVEVREGIAEGDAVVVAANFLIDAESNLKAALSGLTAAPMPRRQRRLGQPPGHGTLEAIDLQGGVVTMTHGPVASLKWPAMTMDFILANPSLVDKLKAGAPVDLEFVERGTGEWVITKMDAKATAASAAAAHKGH